MFFQFCVQYQTVREQTVGVQTTLVIGKWWPHIKCFEQHGVKWSKSVLFFFFEKVMVFMKSVLGSFHSLINPLDPVWVVSWPITEKMSNSFFSLNLVNL